MLKIGDGRNLRYDLCEYERRLHDAASEEMSQFRPLTNAVPVNTRLPSPKLYMCRMAMAFLSYSFTAGEASPNG